VTSFTRTVLRPAAIAAGVTGLTLLLLNPPSLSGAEELVAVIGAAVALVLVTAWATVALAGGTAESEREFERVVTRSEALARRPRRTSADGEFELRVADAIDRLPEQFQRVLEQVPVVISRRGGEAGAYGHYLGDTVARDNYPDRIVLYQDTLEHDFGYDPDLLAAQIERTLRHELAHHLGWNERGVEDIGL